MKRDMELVRKIVLAIEDSPNGFAPRPLGIEGFTDDQIAYHCYLLIDAGFAAGADLTTMRSKGPAATITKLTWAGHEFADASRDLSRWKTAMNAVKDKAGTVTIAVLSQLLGSLMKESLGIK